MGLIKTLFVPISEEIIPYSYPYFGIIYKVNGAVIDVKDSFTENSCSNLNCTKRKECVEGCRRYVRFGSDGIMQPCGIRTDNILDLSSEYVTIDNIKESLASGGKI